MSSCLRDRAGGRLGQCWPLQPEKGLQSGASGRIGEIRLPRTACTGRNRLGLYRNPHQKTGTYGHGRRQPGLHFSHPLTVSSSWAADQTAVATISGGIV